MKLVLYLLPTLCAHTVLHMHNVAPNTHRFLKKKHTFMHGNNITAATHRQSNEQGLYTCTPMASIFVCFFLKVHHPPLESSESHAGGGGGGGAAAGKCVRGGRLRGPAWNLQSPRRVRGRGPAPYVQSSGEQSRTEERRAEERASAQWKHTVHQHTALKPHG